MDRQSEQNDSMDLIEAIRILAGSKNLNDRERQAFNVMRGYLDDVVGDNC